MKRQGIPFNTHPQDPVLSPRILEAARQLLFIHGVSGLTMDLLARELGMSKKTIYVYFPGKDWILAGIVDAMAATLHKDANLVLSNKGLNCTERLCAVIETIGGRMARLTPTMLLDLKRNAPAVYDKIDAIRRHNIPYIFGQIIRDGLADGTIRSDIDPKFVIEFWLQAIRGLMDPDTLEQTRLSPQQTLEQAVELFFRGLLSPTGREQFQKHQQKCRRHSTPTAQKPGH